MSFPRQTVLALAAVGLALGLVLLGLGLAGFPPVGVLAEWVGGAVGGSRAWATNFKAACPLLMTGLAAGVAFRCGVLNIGAEGQFVLGSIGLVSVTTRLWPDGPGWPVLVLGLLAAAVLGALWAGLAGLLDRYRGVPVVLSTILLNVIAVCLLDILLHGPLQAAGSTSPQSPPLDPRFCLPVWLAGTSLHAGIALAAAAAGLVWVLERWTVWGYEMRVTGLNPLAAAWAGIPVPRRRLSVLLLSGALAGLGGGIEVAGVSHVLVAPEGVSGPGYGYAGIAVAMLGNLHPLGIAAAALFFGLLDTGATSVRFAYKVPSEIADIVKGTIVLLILLIPALPRWRRKAANELQPETRNHQPGTSIP